MSRESGDDLDLSEVIAAEENCARPEAIGHAVQIHNEHTFVTEAAVLAQLGSLALRRFPADIRGRLGGDRERRSTTKRYHGASPT